MMLSRYIDSLTSMILGAALLCGAGCGKVSFKPDAGVDGTPPGCADPPCYEVVATKPVNNHDLDLLFVVDNSGTMAEEQATLAANFNQFITVLEGLENGLPNLHIGVVSTDLGAGTYNIAGCTGEGDAGELQNTPQGACEGPNGAYIEDIASPDGSRQKNYAGDLSAAFACIAQLGITGCGFEQPLESMRRALAPASDVNAGFLRPDANLGVVFITDEDDCSTRDTSMFNPDTTAEAELGPISSFRCFEFGVQCAGDSEPRAPGPRQDCVPRENSPYMYGVQEYIDFLYGLKSSPEQVMVAGIIGNPTPVSVGQDPDLGIPLLAPSCTTNTGEAFPGVRLRAFLDGFSLRNVYSSICNDNFSPVLAQLGELFTRWLQSACLVGPIHDTEPATPGLQYDCTALEVAGGVSNPVPQCDNPTAPNASSNLPCYLIALDAEQCGTTESRLAVSLYRGGAPNPPGARVEVTCQVD